MKNPCKKLACKFLHELLQADFLHANLSIFLQRLILLMKIHASCVADVADVKLETNIVEKRSFCGERENNLLYTFSYYDRERHVL